jgi:hypothetical protein
LELKKKVTNLVDGFHKKYIPNFCGPRTISKGKMNEK